MAGRHLHQVTLEELIGSGRDFATASETASILRCDPRTVRRSCEDGLIPGIRVGVEYRIPVAWLREQAGVAA
jgi:excisionase family DNA binding protein